MLYKSSFSPGWEGLYPLDSRRMPTFLWAKESLRLPSKWGNPGNPLRHPIIPWVSVILSSSHHWLVSVVLYWPVLCPQAVPAEQKMQSVSQCEDIWRHSSGSQQRHGEPWSPIHFCSLFKFILVDTNCKHAITAKVWDIRLFSCLVITIGFHQNLLKSLHMLIYPTSDAKFVGKMLISCYIQLTYL